MSLSEQVAKKAFKGDIFQSFEGHTIDSLLILRDYVLKNKAVLNNFAENFKIDFDVLINLMFLSVYLHDIGKLTLEFQQKIKHGEKCGFVSHAFFGVPFVNSNLPDDLDNLLRLLVLSHHTQLYNRIYKDANLKAKVGYLDTDIECWIKSVEDIYSNYFDSLFCINYYPAYMYREYLSKLEYNAEISRVIEESKQKQRRTCKDIRTKAIYSLCLSILKHCDQKASKNFDDMNLAQGIHGPLLETEKGLLDLINYDQKNIFNINESAILGANENGENILPYKFQSDLAKIEGSVIISAPCGRGKTEGALLAALNIIKIKNKNKIIFALPTQITSNAMFERLGKKFGKNNVGLYHGMSRYHHYEIDDIKEENAIKNLVFDEKVFEKPITVTTIDHLIYSLVHGYRQADFALGNILNSVIIFDEIHYYENYTLRYILESLKIFSDLDIPYIAMSGTLPRFIVDELNKIQKHAFIEDVEGMDFEPFIIRKDSELIFESTDKIKLHYNDDKNQIIIVNTIARAKKMYKLLLENGIPKKNLYLLHSQLTFNDRTLKEKEIGILKKDKKRPWILVSTQAIEISVDISCDIMHTELAPVDALGQRGGRLNRGGRNHENEHFMYVYPPENHKPYHLDDNEEDFVEKTNSIIEEMPISYKIFGQWCDRVFTDLNLQPQNLEMVFKKCILFGLSPKEIRYTEEKGNLVEVRDIEDITIDVIPERYWSEIKNKPWHIEKYKVKIPKWWYAKYGKDGWFYVSESNNDKKYIICTLPYSNEFGFDTEKIIEEMESGIF